jgi:hypothetical protein
VGSNIRVLILRVGSNTRVLILIEWEATHVFFSDSEWEAILPDTDRDPVTTVATHKYIGRNGSP